MVATTAPQSGERWAAHEVFAMHNGDLQRMSTAHLIREERRLRDSLAGPHAPRRDLIERLVAIEHLLTREGGRP